MNVLAHRSVLWLVLAAGMSLSGSDPATAQTADKPAAKSSSLRGKPAPAAEGSVDKQSTARGGASPMDAMKETTAPKPGAMPLGSAPAKTGKIGTDSTSKGKLGTPPDPNNKDRPPRPN